MKLKRLQLNNFVGIAAADVEFDKPVTLFVGQNNAGKSSVRDAVLFALSGKARALTKFKDVKRLSRGNNGMAVDLDYETNDGTPIDVHRTPSSVSTAIDERAVLRYCFNPTEFIALPAKDRAGIFTENLGGGMKELIREAIKKHLGKVNNTLKAELQNSGVNMLDIDAFRKEVVECRRAYKRTLAELPAKPPLKGDYELDQDYDIAKDEADVKTLAERIAKSADLIADARKMVETEVEITQLEGEIKKLEASRKDVPNMPRGVSRDKLNMAPVYTSIQEAVLKNHDSNCPVCKGAIDEAALEKFHDEIVEWFGKYQEKLNERNAAIQHNERIDRDLENKRSLLESAKARFKKVNLPAGSENKLKQLQADRDAAQERIANHRRFTEAMDNYTEAGNRRSSLEALIDECDRVDEALKDGGPVKAAIAAGGRKLPINESLLKLWGMDTLEWHDNGEIILNGRLIEDASESEKYRAASVMALALSEVSGVRIAAIDGFEILVSGNANAFFKVVNELNLNNVLVFQSTDKDWSQVNNRPDWLRVFQVEQGEVRPV